jgi:hypothetical protein
MEVGYRVRSHEAIIFPAAGAVDYLPGKRREPPLHGIEAVGPALPKGA